MPLVSISTGENSGSITRTDLDVIRSVDTRNVSSVATLVSSILTTTDGLSVDLLAGNSMM